MGRLGTCVNVTNALILAWICAIWWGERHVFRTSLAACHWHQWEKWVRGGARLLCDCFAD